MNLTPSAITEESSNEHRETPGQQFIRLRESRGYTQEYVAGQLHLRTQIIQLLEEDAYQLLPEPVFIKGYMRAYAKLLNVPHEPFLSIFNTFTESNRPPVEKALLWQQGRRESTKKEKMMRWMSLVVVITLMVMAGLWWQRGNEMPTWTKISRGKTPVQIKSEQAKIQESPTLLKLQSLFTPPQNTPEIKRG